ncbi:MAG: DUF1697 domain-containing protein [Cyclobacteriaceae bacterium]|nr:DUF1697 domain-containing protein [Cyclobacteriaceae bacterium]
MKIKEKYIAFLRGINVGGHHKVPMDDLCVTLKKLKLTNIVTILNSGNILFESNDNDLENKISTHLEKSFGFPIPTIIRKAESITSLLNTNPFKGIKVNKDIRLYVSFLKKNSNTELKLPWKSVDNSYVILEKKDKIIFSVLDLSKSKTPKAMEALEKYFGKDITTRNWKTIERIGEKLITNE